MIHPPDVEAEFTLLAKGGRETSVFSGYRPTHRIKDNYLTTGIHHYINSNEVRPGETVFGTIKFITPEAYPHCLWVGRILDVQEGSRVVGQARITRIMNPVLATYVKEVTAES